MRGRRGRCPQNSSCNIGITPIFRIRSGYAYETMQLFILRTATISYRWLQNPPRRLGFRTQRYARMPIAGRNPGSSSPLGDGGTLS
jgi:hypothetical protein